MNDTTMLNEEVLEAVSGGITKNMAAAFDVINGKYGNDQTRVVALQKAGYNPSVIQGLVNDWLRYGNVARDVIAGKYGTGNDRSARLASAGYDADVIQNLVNQFLQ